MTPREIVTLWLAGSGLNEEQTNTVLQDDRVRFELEQSQPDAVGLHHAISSASSRLGKNAFPGGAKEQLNFMVLFSEAHA